MRVKAHYMPCLLCPECGHQLHWEDAPEDHPGAPIRVKCLTPHCELKGRLFEPNWPEIELEEIVSEDVAVN